MRMKSASSSAFLLLCLASAAQAADDSERGVSLYDQFPSCSERRQVQPGEPAPCELPAPVPERRGVVGQQGASGPTGNSSVGTTQGGQRSQGIGAASGGAGAAQSAPRGGDGGGRVGR